MIINNLKVTIRSLWKNKVSSAINLFGLTVGLTSCLLISLYIGHEASFDSFQKNGNRIARVIMEYSFDGSPESKRSNFTSTKVAPEFSRTFPEVQYGIRMADRDMIIKHNDNLVTEPYFVFADSTFFKIFSADLLQGNPAEALNGPFKVVLTESTAKKYFGNESPMGKILLTGSDEEPYEVTGVIRDYPTNSQLRFDFLASFCSLGRNQEVTYFDANYTTYLLLKDKHAFAPLQKKITSFMRKEMAGSGASINFLLEPFDKIHLHSEYSGFVPSTSITYL
ncbi:MAG TPA: ABC transporter permease, partial [Chryseolinea sp.]|nr:ABC transporter permease [Chryseolinea sp.]